MAALGGGVVNVYLLIEACLNPTAQWDPVWVVWWSVGFFASLLLGVEAVLFAQLTRIDSELEVQERQAGIRS